MSFPHHGGFMEIRQIRSFLSIAETLHFGRSAKILHMSQPALSLQIKALEEDMEVKLLERNRRGVALTEAGNIFRENVVTALEQLEIARQKAQWTESGHLGQIRVGFISTAGQEIVPNLMRRFRKRYPKVGFSLRNILTIDQVGMIQEGTLDVGFLRLPIERPKGLSVTTIHREPLVAVLPADHPLASRKELRLSELRGDKFVGYERSHAPGFHDWLAGILSRAGVVPEITQTAGEMATLVSLINSGLGAAILPFSAIKHRASGVAVCRITDKLPPSEIGMITVNNSKAPAVERFCELARTVFRV
jgi:DNA-binding transcriptional LysR family regulator